ncbi:MAG: hypothetical protein HY392_05610 [Candidatus Diapherotrites archaeon]|nr:hypothetical protein [Candidatus Diapherotrites archaeon]
MENRAIGLFLIGIALGKLLPEVPAPLEQINAFLPFAFILIAIVVLVKGN